MNNWYLGNVPLMCACYACGFVYVICIFYVAHIICMCVFCVMPLAMQQPYTLHVWYDHCSVCVDFVCYTHQCVTCIYVLCTLSVLHEFYLYFVSVLYCVCFSCVFVSVCVLGELGQIVTAEPKKKEKKLLTLQLHIKHLSCMYIHGDCKQH